MNKKLALLAVAALGLMTTACSDDDNNGVTIEESPLKPIIEDYVNNTVVPTYRGLADATMELADLCDKMCEDGPAGITAAQVKEAGDKWIEARRYWELSEAWLFGAAADYNIDPHIDTWPLDKSQMESMLNNPAQMAHMADRESAGEYVGNNLGQGLLGFHAIEYMLFEPADATTATTSPRPVSKFTANELFYLAAVADDLRNCCLRLEASWAGAENTSAAKLAILDDAELDYSVNYGKRMITAGQAGSTYVNFNEAVEELIIGAQDIADEVGNQKIGSPIGAGSVADPDYIESPYALNSITDFIDNLRSVRNAYAGFQALPGENEAYIKPSTHTLNQYVASLDPALNTRVLAAIDNASAAIAKMREPFASTSRDQSMHDINFAAVDACNEVVDVFDEVIDLLSKH